MDRKKWIFGIVIVLILSVFLGFYLLYQNYQLGLRLYNEVNEMSVKTHNIAASVAFLEEKRENGQLDLSDDRHAFDQAITDVAWIRFGAEDMPFTETVRSAWIQKFDEIYRQNVVNDTENKGLEKLLTEKGEDLSEIQSTMEKLTQSFMEFRDRYNQMSLWQRCTASWKKEIMQFSELAGMP